MSKKKKTILFYSSTRNKSNFGVQQFYRQDIQILEELGYRVRLSNRVWDAWLWWRYDMVFAYFYRYSFFTALIARLFGRPTYITGGIDDLERSYAKRGRYRVQSVFFRLCYRVAKRCIVVSESDRQNMEKIVGKDATKLVLSEHAIEVAKYVDSEQIEKTTDFVSICWMEDSENVHRKGVDTAIRMIGRLRQKPAFRESKLYVIGPQGKGSVILKEIAKEEQVEDAVVFTRTLSEEDKINLLKRCRYYVQLSKYEGFAMAALEAYAAGCLLIHSGRGGLDNPLYKEHVKVDLSHSIDEMAEEVGMALAARGEEVPKRDMNTLRSKYDIGRRKHDFQAILD